MRTSLAIASLLCLPVGPVARAGDPVVATDLVGTWDEITPDRRPGFRMPRELTVLTVVGSAFLWDVRDGGTYRQSLFIPVRAGSGRGIDFVTVNSSSFLTTRALFKIEGRRLTIKESAIDGPRPTDLEPREFDALQAEPLAIVKVYWKRDK